MLFLGECSAVGGGIRCRVRPIPNSRLGFPAQPNQALHPFVVGDFTPDLGAVLAGGGHS